MAVFAMAPLFTIKHYSTPSWSPVLLNLALIATCLALHKRFENPAWALVAGVWLGGIAQLIAMYVAMYRHTGVIAPSFALRHPGVGKALLLLAPVIIGQTAGEINKLVDSFFAYSLEDGTVSALFYANRLVQFPLSIFGIAVAAAILPSISRAGARNDDEAIRGTLVYGLRQSFFLVAPAMVGLLLLGEPVIRLLFQHGRFDAALAEKASVALFYYSFGLLTFAWVKVAVQGFFAIQNTKLPVMVASFSMLLNILLNCALVRPMGFRGLALSTSISFAVNFLLLYVLLSNRFGLIWDKRIPADFARIGIALAIMAALTYGLSNRIQHIYGIEAFGARAAAVLIPMLAAAAAYAGMCRVLRVPELEQFLTAMFGRSAPADRG